MTDLLPADATIASLLDRLNSPNNYIQNVFKHMWDCKKKFGDASVRIGISGEGKAPHYRIEYTNDRGTAIYGVYRGQGHKLFDDLGDSNIIDIVLSDDPNEFAEVANELEKREAPERPDHLLQAQNWSSHAMSFKEVGALRTELQKRRK
jgi:hypothetical protein